MQILELVIFAALAAVVLFQLYTVLGRRVGRQPEDAAEAQRPKTAEIEPRRIEDPIDEPRLTGLAALRARDPQFDASHFLDGAKAAYEMVVRAFAEGDRATLKSLTLDPVFKAFDGVLTQREAEGRSEKVEFLNAPRADIEGAEVDGSVARLKVRFLAEFRSRSKGPEGEAVDDRRTAEVWTFERLLDSRDPNWALARVDAAQA